MKQIMIYKYLLAGVIFCLASVWLCSACQDAETSGRETLTFEFQLPPALEVETRSGTLDKILIDNVWVVQYNSQTGAFIKADCFSDNKIGTAQTNQTIKVETSDFSMTPSNFYVIANAGTTFLTGFTGTQADLKAKKLDITAGTTSQPRLLVSDPLPYTPTAGGNVVIVAPLQRTFAQVSLTWSAPSAIQPLITISGVDVYDLPKNMALYSREGSDDLSIPYPAYSDTNKDNFVTGATAVKSNLPVGEELVFYMAENLRGMGTGTSFSEKNLPAKGPGASVGGCTRVVLKGTYQYSEASAPIKVNYTIYLGGNLMNDYNIQRGTLYKMIININGANSADVRVTITDGNVIVFDKVVEINNKVDF
ncbi:DUF4906 domain-containing protein [Bacteroides sp.]